MYEEPVLLGTRDAISGASRSWFVYLFALTDCSGFKVGFSCNPMQRIHTFSRRYFERFDVYQSWLLELDAEDDARSVEATLKPELAGFRSEAPPWVPMDAGGHTEWFSAVQLRAAEDRLRSFESLHEIARVGSASDFFRHELARLSASFESWAVSQARLIGGRSFSVREMRASLDIARSLRDWLDAYRYFDLPLFAQDPAAFQFVRAAATTN
jgi:hypothetical protein